MSGRVCRGVSGRVCGACRNVPERVCGVCGVCVGCVECVWSVWCGVCGGIIKGGLSSPLSNRL